MDWLNPAVAMAESLSSDIGLLLGSGAFGILVIREVLGFLKGRSAAPYSANPPCAVICMERFNAIAERQLTTLNLLQKQTDILQERTLLFEREQNSLSQLKEDVRGIKISVERREGI